MSFYLKKSIKAGPFRFNLSKSGIGVSTGIKGLRVGTGPRGNYVLRAPYEGVLEKAEPIARSRVLPTASGVGLAQQ